jgi:phosphoribosylformylglycinamidine synthase subunit PurQ / glutaminase
MRIGVVTFPGSLDDGDALRAIRLAGGEPQRLWHKERDLRGVSAIVLPGGFSYGDYVRAGAIASLAPIMSEIVVAAGKGLPILGICNGFQMLTEAHLVPGALVRNSQGTFIRKNQMVRLVNASTPWTERFSLGDDVILPLKSGEGRFVATSEQLKRLEGEGAVVCRYVGNPNGSLDDIAGVCNKRGNVVGIMPHPEHAVEPGFGPDTPAAMRSGIHGLTFFTSVLSTVMAA